MFIQIGTMERQRVEAQMAAGPKIPMVHVAWAAGRIAENGSRAARR
jgi:hypothetical protein